MMRKEEVIEAIDKLIELENQKQSILSEYQDVILSYADNRPLSLDFEECDYIRDLLTRAKEEIINYWDEEHDYDRAENELDESIAENNPKAQEIRDVIYSMLMTHSDYFRKDFLGQKKQKH
jgi:hypothetical protein